MEKVNLDLLRQVDQVREEALRIMLEATRILWSYETFCYECGRIKPESGFYPLVIQGPNSISGLICNDCRRKPL